MHTIANKENEEHKAILNQHFGEHHDIEAIRKHVNMLRTGEVKIGAIKAVDLDPLCAASTTGKPGSKIVKFGPYIHSAGKTTQDTAGTLIHEATHALWGTRDRYQRVGVGENAHLVGVGAKKYFKLEKDEGERKNLVKGCKFYILLDTISR